MSRSGYNTDSGSDDNWGMIRYQGALASSIRGKRGQALLRELLAGLDAMPVKELVAEELATADGQFCALGVVGCSRGIDMKNIDPEDYDAVAALFDIATPLAREIVYNNDEWVDAYKWVEVEICGPMRPWDRHARTARIDLPAETVGAKRWRHMREWVASQLTPAAPVLPIAAPAGGAS